MKDMPETNASSIAIYGPAGIGKTRLAFSFPCKKKRFALNFEAGLKTSKHVPASVYSPKVYVEIARGLDWLEQDDEHDVVITDTLTECGRLVQTSSNAGGTKPHPELTNQQDFYLTVERMRNIIRRIRLLIQKGKTVIFTCAETIDKDAMTGRMIGGPDLPGNKLGVELCYLVDEVYRMVAGSGGEAGKRFIITEPDMMYSAKTRVPGTPSRILVPFDKPEQAFNHLLK